MYALTVTARKAQLSDDDAVAAAPRGGRPGVDDAGAAGDLGAVAAAAPGDRADSVTPGIPVTVATKPHPGAKLPDLPPELPTCPDPTHRHVAPVRLYYYGFDYIDEAVAYSKVTFDIEEQTYKVHLPNFVLQDANYNVVGVTSNSGALLQQYSHAPYGEYTFIENGNGTRYNGVDADTRELLTVQGHGGLWYDPETGLIYMRGRYYDPVTGRFIQRDPNETALILANLLRRNAQNAMITAGLWPGGQYGNGSSLYQYVGSNPLTNSDPSGLYFGQSFEDEIDELIADLEGDKLTTIGYIQTGAAFTGMGVELAANTIGNLLGFDLLKWTMDIARGEATLSDNPYIQDIMGIIGSYKSVFLEDDATAWDYITVGLTVAPFLGKVVKGIQRGFNKAKAKFQRASRKPFQMSLPILQRVCFVAGTAVLMGNGTTRPIEAVRVGDVVACDLNPGEDDGPEVCTVTAAFQRTTDRVLDLTVETDAGTVTITTTPEHPF